MFKLRWSCADTSLPASVRRHSGRKRGNGQDARSPTREIRCQRQHTTNPDEIDVLIRRRPHPEANEAETQTGMSYHSDVVSPLPLVAGTSFKLPSLRSISRLTLLGRTPSEFAIAVVVGATVMRVPERQSLTDSFRQNGKLLIRTRQGPGWVVFSASVLVWLKIPNAQLDCIKNRLRHRIAPYCAMKMRPRMQKRKRSKMLRTPGRHLVPPSAKWIGIVAIPRADDCCARFGSRHPVPSCVDISPRCPRFS